MGEKKSVKIVYLGKFHFDSGKIANKGHLTTDSNLYLEFQRLLKKNYKNLCRTFNQTLLFVVVLSYHLK